jgi:hypothetical protein
VSSGDQWPSTQCHKITERRGRDKQKALWGERMGEMKQLDIEYHADWAAKPR